MPPKRKAETVEDKTKAPPAKKTSEEQTPTISPDKGATGETVTSYQNMAEGTSTKSYDKTYEKAVFELLKKIGITKTMG